MQHTFNDKEIEDVVNKLPNSTRLKLKEAVTKLQGAKTSDEVKERFNKLPVKAKQTLLSFLKKLKYSVSKLDDRDIRDIIYSLGFITQRKVMPKLKEKLPNENPRRFTKVLKQIPRAHRTKKGGTDVVKGLYMNIYSSSPDCWFHDLLINTKKPDYARHIYPMYHLFLGVNNHYAVAYPTTNNDEDTILKNIKDFVSQYHPRKLTSDSEKAFKSGIVNNYLTEHKVQTTYVNASQDNHAGLGAIDRLCATLRKMYRTAYHKDYIKNGNKELFTKEQMEHLIHEYNTTYHYRIKCTPQQMLHDSEREKEYIFNHLEKKDEVEHTPGIELPIGSEVRYHRPPRTIFEKGGAKDSRDYYKVVGNTGLRYILENANGGTKTFSRWQLYLNNPPGTKDEDKILNDWGEVFE